MNAKEDYWFEVERWFEEIKTTIERHVRQTRESARKNPRQEGTNIVPYRRADDQEMLDYCLTQSKELILILKKLIPKKQNTIKFTRAWAQLHYCYGYIQSTMFSSSNDAAQLHGGQKGADKVKKESQMDWFARQIVPRLDAGILRKTANFEVADMLNGFKRTQYPKDAPAKFYKSMLNSDGRLKSTYVNIPIRELRKRAKKQSQAYVLHNCYLDKISRGQVITSAAIRLAAQKYYDGVIRQYFDRGNRFAREPFEQKLDRHNQKLLLQEIVGEARTVKRGITTGELGGKYFEGLSNPPVSHFSVPSAMEPILGALELNFLVTKYHEMRDKNGQDVTIYALSYGLCEAERFAWGYPRGRRDDRSYFVQRCFNYSGIIRRFLTSNQTIECGSCGACFGMDRKDTLEMYKWRCPECEDGKCSVVTLGRDFVDEVSALDRNKMLDPVELEILESLNEESMPLRAKEIGALIDATYQLVGHRTAKMQDIGLVRKFETSEGKKSELTEKAREIYFDIVPLNHSE